MQTSLVSKFIFLEFNKTIFGYNKHVIIGIIYKPPKSNINEFNSDIEKVFQNINDENKLAYLLGDYNINTIENVAHSSGTNEFNNIMSESFFHKLINLHTRVITNKSSSLIDNIHTNTPNCYAVEESGVLEIAITDHYPIFTILHKQFRTRRQTIIKRELTRKNILLFRKQLKKNNKKSNDNPIIFSEFYETITTIFYTCFPLKEIVPKYGNKLHQD